MSTNRLYRLVTRLDNFSEMTGRGIAWLTLAMVLVTFGIVVFRYVFSLGWIWLQESVSYLHAFVFMLGAAYTFKHDGHVRVDIFYRNYTPRQRALVELLGNLLLVLPVCVFIFFNSWDNVLHSWIRLEGSEETDGLDLVYVLKTCMLLMPLLVSLQGIANILRNFLILRGDIEPETPDG
ncbi:MAG: TRAP transporter small permease subunit [Gammaproteobacteria bacterium]|nr:TRAP transporter small permease subunit [Gammaproteobacteria bacterium]